MPTSLLPWIPDFATEYGSFLSPAWNESSGWFSSSTLKYASRRDFANTTLTGASTITSSGNVSFSGTVDGAQTFVVNAGGGVVDFNAAVGGNFALTSFELSGSSLAVTSVRTTGNQTYFDALEIAGVLQSTNATTGLLTFSDSISVAANSQLIADNMDFNGAIGSITSVGGLASLAILPTTLPYVQYGILL